jgi:hypothetical protein
VRHRLHDRAAGRGRCQRDRSSSNPAGVVSAFDIGRGDTPEPLLGSQKDLPRPADAADMAQTRAELMEDEETHKKTIADLDDIQCGRVTEARGMAPDQDTPHSRRCSPLFAHGLQWRRQVERRRFLDFRFVARDKSPRSRPIRRKLRFGWGTWIRTRAVRSRAGSSTAKLSPRDLDGSKSLCNMVAGGGARGRAVTGERNLGARS